MQTATTMEQTEGYDDLERMLVDRVSKAKGPFFVTENPCSLMDIFLKCLPPSRRQHYNCNCCRRFVEKYGCLVTVADDGSLVPFVWEANVPVFFRDAVYAVWDAVRNGKIVGVFLSSDETWGTPFNVPGPGSKYEGHRWTHFNAKNPAVYRERTKTTEQMMAEKLEDRGVLIRALVEYKTETVQEAVRVLQADALSRSEKALEIGRWFLAQKLLWEEQKGRVRDHLLWRQVVLAPPGFCHVKNTMIATLLDDIAVGMDFDTVSKRWSAKMHPLQYQRPQTLSEGNIEAAEKLIAKLGAAKSLERRFATLADITASWLPVATEVKPAEGSVFGHLRQQSQIARLQLPSQLMSWEKFQREVLPGATSIELRVHSGRAPFTALVTAKHADAPPILQWDGLDAPYPCCEGAQRLEHVSGDATTLYGGMCLVHGRTYHPTTPRNPVSWYLYINGSYAQHWNLGPGTWVKVNAIASNPAHWQRPDLFKHQAQQLMFVLEGCKDVNYRQSGGLFPESIKSEFREARAAIEAYSKAGVIADKDASNACGLVFTKGTINWQCNLKVNGDEYTIDRWE